MLEVKKLTVCYNDFLALNEISLKIQEGALTGIIGPNGAGKSTLLKAMLNIIPHQGDVSINNEDINKKLVKIAYVEQKADIDFTFPIKVKECVSMGTYAGMKVFQRIKNAEWQRVSKALEKVDMGKYSNHQIGELSGGQFQRVLLARCLVSITVVIRFFPTYRSEIRMIKESLKMRNIRLSFFQPLQYLEFLLVPVLIRATMIAEEMTANAITKGIESPVKRSSYYKTNMSLLDYIILFSVTIFFLSILI